MNKWADMWEKLVDGGMDEAAATAQVQAAQAAEQTQDRPASSTQTPPRAVPAKPREMSPAMSALVGANQVARGYTGGLSDRLIAGAAGAFDPNKTYGDYRAKIDSANTQFADEHGVLNTALNVGGAFLPGPSLLSKGAGAAAKLIPKAAKGAGAINRGARVVARGALGGAVAGAGGMVGYQDGEADKSLGTTARNAAGGALVGGGMGGLAPVIAGAARGTGGVVADLLGLRTKFRGTTPAGQIPRTPGTGSVLNRAGDWAEGRLFPQQVSRAADRKIASAVTRQGADDLPTAAANLRYDNLMSGNKAMVADLGDDYGTRLARGAKTKSVEASDALKTSFDARDRSLLSDIRGDLQRNVSGRVNRVDAARTLADEASTASKPLYDASARTSVPLSDASKTVLLERDPKKLFAQAHKVAQEMAEEAGEAPIPDLFTKMDAGDGNMVTVLARDNIEVREIDAMKKGLQEIVARGANSGAPVSRSRARALLKNLDEIVQDADLADPRYPQARESFAGPTRAAEAMEIARKGAKKVGKRPALPGFTTGAPDELGAVVSGMGEAQRDIYDVGKAAGIYRQAAKNPRNALRNMNTDDFAERMRATTQPRDMGAVDDLLETASVRQAQGKRAGGIMGGSPTADKMTDAAVSAIPGKAGMLNYAPIRGVLELLMGNSLGGLQSGTAAEVGKRMALQGPRADEYMRYLQALEQYTNRGGLTNDATRRAGVAALFGSQPQ